jgi:hypothetical protein
MDGFNKLARELQEYVKGLIEYERPIAFDYGTIQSNMGLRLNNFTAIIPSGTYTVCRSASELLQPGNRVLVAWVGSDPCVIDLIGRATT